MSVLPFLLYVSPVTDSLRMGVSVDINSSLNSSSFLSVYVEGNLSNDLP